MARNWPVSALRRVSRLPLLRRLRAFVRPQPNNTVGPVAIELHGFKVLLNRGNTYPDIIHTYPLFNAPLVELVHQTHATLQRELTFVNVGAATGDTVLLLKERCKNTVGRFFCVEGEPEFFELLRSNTQQFNNVVPINAILGRDSKQVHSLVKHHLGTAAAIGSDWVDAVPLDSLTQLRNVTIDVLKIDVDDFDGEVLAGACEILERHRPQVIFEWHPKLYLATGCDPFQPFETLAAANYDRYLWFNNIGTFSHFSGKCTPESLQREVDYLLKVNHRADEHFDIIALHRNSKIDDLELAAMDHARMWAHLA